MQVAAVTGSRPGMKTVLLKSGEERRGGAAERKFWRWRRIDGNAARARSGVAAGEEEVREQRWEVEDRSLGSAVVKLITPRNCLN